MTKNIIIAIFLLLLTLVVLFYYNTDSSYQEKIESLKSEKQKAIELHEQQLLKFKHREDSLTLVISTLNIRNKTLLGERDKLDKELNSVNGRYNNHTPTDLEKEMEARWKKGR